MEEEKTEKVKKPVKKKRKKMGRPAKPGPKKKVVNPEREVYKKIKDLTDFKRPFQAATKKGIAIGKDRARQEMMDGLGSHSTLINVSLGYRIYANLLKMSGMTEANFKLLILINHFVKIEKNTMKHFGYVVFKSHLDNLIESGHIMQISTRPFTYRVTAKGKEYIQDMMKYYQEQMEKVKSFEVTRRSFLYKSYNRFIRTTEEKREELLKRFSSTKMGRTK